MFLYALEDVTKENTAIAIHKTYYSPEAIEYLQENSIEVVHMFLDSEDDKGLIDFLALKVVPLEHLYQLL